MVFKHILISIFLARVFLVPGRGGGRQHDKGTTCGEKCRQNGPKATSSGTRGGSYDVKYRTVYWCHVGHCSLQVVHTSSIYTYDYPEPNS